ANGSNQLNIGNLLFGTGLDGEGTTLSSGSIGIGTTSPGSTLSVAGNEFLSGFYNTSGTSGGYKIEGNLVLQASTTNSSTIVGQSACASLLASTTAAGNSCLGFQ